VAQDNTGAARAKSKFEQRKAYILRKFWATVWVGFALFVAKAIHLWDVVTEGHLPKAPHLHLHRGYFKLGLICFGLWVVVAAYLVVWVKYILKVQEEWEEYSPRAIPFATCCGLVGIISCVSAGSSVSAPSTCYRGARYSALVGLGRNLTAPGHTCFPPSVCECSGSLCPSGRYGAS